MDRYIRNIYRGVYTVLVGMRVTIKQFFEPNVTHQYPYEHDYEKKQNVRETRKGTAGSSITRTKRPCYRCKKCRNDMSSTVIAIDATKLPKANNYGIAMNKFTSRRREIIGLIEGDDKKIKSADSITVTNITSRQGSQKS